MRSSWSLTSWVSWAISRRRSSPIAFGGGRFARALRPPRKLMISFPVLIERLQTLRGGVQTTASLSFLANHSLLNSELPRTFVFATILLIHTVDMMKVNCSISVLKIMAQMRQCRLRDFINSQGLTTGPIPGYLAQGSPGPVAALATIASTRTARRPLRRTWVAFMHFQLAGGPIMVWPDPVHKFKK